jgi:predicted HicB family RNase H-like nuclease
MLSVPPGLHGAALVAAQASGKRLNLWATGITWEGHAAKRQRLLVCQALESLSII